MLNLLRMQLRAVFRQKGLYITAAILCFVLLIAFGTMRLVSDPALAEREPVRPVWRLPQMMCLTPLLFRNRHSLIFWEVCFSPEDL